MLSEARETDRERVLFGEISYLQCSITTGYYDYIIHVLYRVAR